MVATAPPQTVTLGTAQPLLDAALQPQPRAKVRLAACAVSPPGSLPQRRTTAPDALLPPRLPHRRPAPRHQAAFVSSASWGDAASGNRSCCPTSGAVRSGPTRRPRRVLLARRGAHTSPFPFPPGADPAAASFAIGKEEHLRQGAPCTQGVDVAITSEHLVLLDARVSQGAIPACRPRHFARRRRLMSAPTLTAPPPPPRAAHRPSPSFARPSLTPSLSRCQAASGRGAASVAPSLAARRRCPLTRPTPAPMPSRFSWRRGCSKSATSSWWCRTGRPTLSCGSESGLGGKGSKAL